MYCVHGIPVTKACPDCDAEGRHFSATRGDGKIGDLKEALSAAKLKLRCYRDRYGLEYVGGMEYSALMRKIDEALKG